MSPGPAVAMAPRLGTKSHLVFIYVSDNQRMTLLDFRPANPGQLAAIGAAAWLIGSLIHVLAVLAPIGLVLLLIAGLAWLVRPRTRTTYWRGRPVELTDDSRTAAHRLYRALFRR